MSVWRGRGVAFGGGFVREMGVEETKISEREEGTWSSIVVDEERAMSRKAS